jgi:hypothetical protein
VNGGTGQYGQTTVEFIEQIELGGALELQHGDRELYGGIDGSDRRIVCGNSFCGGMPGRISGHAVWSGIEGYRR